MGGALSMREAGRKRRHVRLRKRVQGSSERPRLVVHRSHLHLYAQMVDDFAGKTLLSCSTQDAEFRKQAAKGGTLEAAKRLGEALAKEASGAGIKKVVFDRGGYVYHGRVKALADAAREHGLEF
ncbi:MAG: 50S ribosomal protein L18 [Candidatus Omnitrophica bacterium]|nr:50S ribosomal protein L18 [Candidatus Omnitrophota bacterium]